MTTDEPRQFEDAGEPSPCRAQSVFAPVDGTRITESEPSVKTRPARRTRSSSTIRIRGQKLPRSLFDAVEYQLEYQRRLHLQRGKPSLAWELTADEFLLLDLYLTVQRLHHKRQREQFEEWFHESNERSAQRQAAYEALTPADREAADQEHRDEQRRNSNSARREAWKRTNGPRAPYALAGIYERDGGTCAWCLGPVSRAHRSPDPRTASLDHIQELSQGGTDHPDNIALTHLFCNMDRPRKGKFVSPEYARYRLALRVELGRYALSGYPPQAELNAWDDGREWALAECTRHQPRPQ